MPAKQPSVSMLPCTRILVLSFALFGLVLSFHLFLPKRFVFAGPPPDDERPEPIWRMPSSPKLSPTLITATSPSALSAICGNGKHVAVANSISLKHFRTICAFKIDWDSLVDIKSDLEIVVGLQESGTDAAFDPAFVPWARELSIAKAEDWIDESCKLRRNPRCSIREIGILRAAYLWKHLADEALHAKYKGFFVRFVHVSNPSNAPLAVTHRLSHKALIDQILIHQHDVTIRLGLNYSNASLYNDQIRKVPLEKPIDAGSCWISKERGMRCLPSFLIIGAQKAGTDELSVWLNFNPYHKRLDGGAETHFFDCVGRGLGKERGPCYRPRPFSGGNKALFTQDMQTKNDSADWSWDSVRLHSPFMDDHLFEFYIRLGRLYPDMYFRQPSRTLMYEKTPSYSDLANPNDVARLLPSVKLVFLTRDPVPRLYSSYWQSCDSIPKTEPLCNDTEFEEIVGDLLFNKSWTPGARFGRYATMHRAMVHGMYAKTLQPWVDAFSSKNQMLIVDAHHMRIVPQAVVYAVETFVGNRGKLRHREYKPRWENGYWVLGDYSKAKHPSHPSTGGMSANLTVLLKEFYRPHIEQYRDFLTRHGDVVAQGCVGEPFPPELRTAHPDLFVGKGHNSFALPPWVLEVGGSNVSVT